MTTDNGHHQERPLDDEERAYTRSSGSNEEIKLEGQYDMTIKSEDGTGSMIPLESPPSPPFKKRLPFNAFARHGSHQTKATSYCYQLAMMACLNSCNLG